MANQTANYETQSNGQLFSSRKHIFACLAIVIVAFAYNGWVMNDNQFFYADDWGWIKKSEFQPWTSYFHLLPSSIYNDRPVGALLIKLVYTLFHLNHTVYAFTFVTLHAVNCLLVYVILLRYVPVTSAFIAAFLGATWLSSQSALTWTAAVFDVLGTTLCLATILFRQISIRKNGSLLLDILGAVCFLLAIRTKEFALGTIALLLLFNLVADRQKLSTALKQLTPYLIVFVVLGMRYAYLHETNPITGDNLYKLDFSPVSIAKNLGFYLWTLMYGNVVGAVGITLATLLLVTATLGANRAAKGLVIIGVCGVVIMLGPTLLLPKHRDELYLYAPHFFMALAIGSAYARAVPSKLLALVLALGLFLTPFASGRRVDVRNFYETQGIADITQFNSARSALGELAKGSKIYITGLTPIFNPFPYQSGDSLQVAYKDPTLDVQLGESQQQLSLDFCRATEPKRMLIFKNQIAHDVTKQAIAECPGGAS